MPKASVNEDSPFPTAVRDVGRAGEISIVNAEPMAKRMEKSANGQLGGGAVLPDATESRRGVGVDDEIGPGRR